MARPWIKIYRKRKGERIDYKRDEVGALWRNVDEASGRVWLSGKLGARSAEKPQVEVVAYIEDEDEAEGRETAVDQRIPDDDIPF